MLKLFHLFIFASISHVVHLIEVILSGNFLLLIESIVINVFVYGSGLNDGRLVVLELSFVVEITHILAVINVLLLHICVKLICLGSIHILLVNVILINHHLLILLSLIIKRDDGHFLVCNISVKNNFECVIGLSNSCKLLRGAKLGDRILVYILIHVWDVHVVYVVVGHS